jgi:arsenate reductase
MAEGWARFLKSDEIEAYSAGIETHGLNPDAIRVMQEVGVDIRHHLSQTPDQLTEKNFDVVVTVCGHADDNCPVFPGAKIVHVGFEDPPKLAEECNSQEEALDCYRRVRNEIKEFVSKLPEVLTS